jgi:hypothetical protein
VIDEAPSGIEIMAEPLAPSSIVTLVTTPSISTAMDAPFQPSP